MEPFNSLLRGEQKKYIDSASDEAEQTLQLQHRLTAILQTAQSMLGPTDKLDLFGSVTAQKMGQLNQKPLTAHWLRLQYATALRSHMAKTAEAMRGAFPLLQEHLQCRVNEKQVAFQEFCRELQNRRIIPKTPLPAGQRYDFDREMAWISRVCALNVRFREALRQGSNDLTSLAWTGRLAVWTEFSYFYRFPDISKHAVALIQQGDVTSVRLLMERFHPSPKEQASLFFDTISTITWTDLHYKRGEVPVPSDEREAYDRMGAMILSYMEEHNLIQATSAIKTCVHHIERLYSFLNGYRLTATCEQMRLMWPIPRV